jgi:putative endonuclease
MKTYSEYNYYTYIVSSASGVLYIGVTNDLMRRASEHKRGLIPGFSKRYRTKRLVYFEQCDRIEVAIAREKELKGWRRSKKIALIRSFNPTWKDYCNDYNIK